MDLRLKTIGELPAELLIELLLQYDAYIVEFFDEGLHEEGMTPVCVHEFYENEFLGYAEEKVISWKLYADTLQYSYSKKEDGRVDIIVGAVLFSIDVPMEVFNDDPHSLTQYIEDNYGEMIFNIMNELDKA